MITAFPPVYGIISTWEKVSGVHRRLIIFANLTSVVILGVIILNDIPDSDLISFLIWRVVSISLLIYSWNLEKLPIFLYLTESLLGLIVLWKLLVFFIPVSNLAIPYLLILNGSASIALIAMVLFGIQAGGYMILKSSELKNLLIALLILLGIKMIWGVGSSILLEAEDLSENFILAVYLWNYVPFPSIGGIILGTFVPAVLTVLLLIEKFQRLVKKFMITSFISIIIGEFLYKYLLVQYGFSF